MAVGDHRLRAMARLAVEGRTASEIADLLSVAGVTVQRYLDAWKVHRGDSPPEPEPLAAHEIKFCAFAQEYEERLLEVQYLHRWRLTDWLDESYEAVGRCLRSGEMKVVESTAWKVFDAVIGPGERPNPSPAAGANGHSLQVNVQLNQEVVRATTMLTGVAAQLEAAGTQTYLNHLRSPDANTGQLVEVGVARPGAPSNEGGSA